MEKMREQIKAMLERATPEQLYIIGKLVRALLGNHS